MTVQHPDDSQSPTAQWMQRVIGVFDLMGDCAVHAVAGQRDRYQPLAHTWCPEGRAGQLACRYAQLGIRNFYIADIDAIQTGQSRSQRSYRSLGESLHPWLSTPLAVDCTPQIWLDSGGVVEPWQWLMESDLPAVEWRWVVGTESLRNWNQLKQFKAQVAEFARHQPCRLTICLDLRGGQFQTAAADQSGFEDLWRFANEAVTLGVTNWILLDLAAVGTEGGPRILPLCRLWKARFPNTALVSGGGVRNFEDVQALIQSGCDSVLCATWLQRLSPAN